MTLARTTSSAAFEAVANDPRVRAGLGFGTASLSLDAVVGDLNNFAFGDDEGGFVFEGLGGGRYELHTLLSSSVRGRAALARAGEVIGRMFTETDAAEIVTRIPGNLKHADLMARRAGFAEVWTLEDAWPGPDGPTSLRLFSMGLNAWMMRDGALPAQGEVLAAALFGAEADDVCRRAAGMAAAMIAAGNHDKAVWAYSRWAQLARRAPLRRVAGTPAVFEAADTRLQFHTTHLEILTCQ